MKPKHVGHFWDEARVAGFVHRVETASTSVGRDAEFWSWRKSRWWMKLGRKEDWLRAAARQRRTSTVSILQTLMLPLFLHSADGGLLVYREPSPAPTRPAFGKWTHPCRTAKAAERRCWCCLVALRDEICFPAAACVGPGRPNVISRTCGLEVTRLYCSAPGIRPSPGWRDAAVVIAPQRTWRTVAGLTFTRTQSFNSFIYCFNSHPNRHFHFPSAACSSVIFQHSQGRQR